MQVVEKFISINGEGVRSGELAVFIRFKGCNLNCSYCDTVWANESDAPYSDETPEDLQYYIDDTAIRNVTLTGGEPLLQKDISRLIEMLSARHRVEIETNGSVDISKFPRDNLSYTMDYKLPTSNMEKHMLHSNFEHLTRNDTVKFVSGSTEDLDRAYNIINEYNLTDRCNVHISPIFGELEPEEIVDYMKRKRLNDVKLALQIHKFIWEPTRRGV